MSQQSILLTIPEVCLRYRICRRTLYVWLERSQIPMPFKIGNRVYWREETLLAWEAKLQSQANEQNSNQPAELAASK